MRECAEDHAAVRATGHLLADSVADDGDNVRSNSKRILHQEPLLGHTQQTGVSLSDPSADSTRIRVCVQTFKRTRRVERVQWSATRVVGRGASELAGNFAARNEDWAGAVEDQGRANNIDAVTDCGSAATGTSGGRGHHSLGMGGGKAWGQT